MNNIMQTILESVPPSVIAAALFAIGSVVGYCAGLLTGYSWKQVD